jgi:hypothetical protein
MRSIHCLKTWPGYFGPVLDGSKTFEVRKQDRDFRVGDVLVLQEWEPASKVYTGRVIAKRVTHLMTWMIESGHCAMSLGPIEADIETARIAEAIDPRVG